MKRIIVAHPRESIITQFLRATPPDVDVAAAPGTVAELAAALNRCGKVDLIITAIHFPDGSWFDLREPENTFLPLVFISSSFDDARKAFEYICLDYLVNPVAPKEIRRVFYKLNVWASTDHKNNNTRHDSVQIKRMKQRILVRAGHKTLLRAINDVAFFYAEGKAVYLTSRNDSRKMLIDYTLDELESILDKTRFFRTSRKYIVNIDAIAEVRTAGSRPEIRFHNTDEESAFVSRDRITSFKKWIDQ